MDNKSKNVRTAIEIGTLAGQLNVTNQAYVLNTINALLFSQQVTGPVPAEHRQEKGSDRQDLDEQK